MKRSLILTLLGVALLATACGGGETPATETTESTAPAVTKIELRSVGDQMKFNLSEIRVKAGQPVEITLVNEGVSELMKHNFVLVTNGSVQAVGTAAATAGEAMNYVPEMPEVIYASAMTGPGETITFTFDAPAPGTYQFVCTFPGHWALMNGTFIVE